MSQLKLFQKEITILIILFSALSLILLLKSRLIKQTVRNRMVKQKKRNISYLEQCLQSKTLN